MLKLKLFFLFTLITISFTAVAEAQTKKRAPAKKKPAKVLIDEPIILNETLAAPQNPAPATEPGWMKYASAQYTIEYPGDWTMVPAKGIEPFMLISPRTEEDDNIFENMNLQTRAFPLKTAPAPLLESGIKEGIQASDKKLKIVKTEYPLWSGAKSVRVHFTTESQEGVKLRGFVSGAVFNGKLFMASCFVEESKYEEYLPTFTKVFSSIKPKAPRRPTR